MHQGVMTASVCIMQHQRHPPLSVDFSKAFMTFYMLELVAVQRPISCAFVKTATLMFILHECACGLFAHVQASDGRQA
jgi:hypothetical protein